MTANLQTLIVMLMPVSFLRWPYCYPMIALRAISYFLAIVHGVFSNLLYGFLWAKNSPHGGGLADGAGHVVSLPV